MFWRVARAIAQAEAPAKRRAWASKFYEAMASLRFLPNSPTLMNAGRREAQLSACFVLPVGDSLDEIFTTLKHAAKIHQSGGGTGFSFSRLRPAGSAVKTTSGIASGPVSFIKIFDVATETIKQGGARRGANMAVLRVDHPDIVQFIDSKRDMKSIVNFNISVGITSKFMEAVQKDARFCLLDPQTGRSVSQVNARELLDRISLSAWECGDPGLVFLDRINQFNPTPSEGDMESTNPCGEQPLLAYESCNLGSLNLGRYCQKGGLDWDLFQRDIHLATRFLDNVITVNQYPIPECAEITLKNRKIGLGVMGFADLLLELGLSYDSAQARTLGEEIMSFLDHEAKQCSMDLAKEKGAFPNYPKSRWKKLGYPKLRNATVSTVAPTGTISIIAGASSGIEPIFAGVFYRNVLSGARLPEVHPAVEKVLREKRIEIGRVTEKDLARLLGPAWSPARAVSIEGHVLMQAVFQHFSDSAVSKTINLPESSTVEDVKKAYRLAYEKGCKGITVYRDKSKPAQVLDCPTC
jgi:ribonucleoside-diphosphate reductase alpha chain